MGTQYSWLAPPCGKSLKLFRSLVLATHQACCWKTLVFQKVVLWFKLVVSPLTLCCFWGHSLLGLALASILGSAHKEPTTE